MDFTGIIIELTENFLAKTVPTADEFIDKA